MKPGAVLINTSRAAAWWTNPHCSPRSTPANSPARRSTCSTASRPLTADHPVVAYAREHDNVLLTPHIGGNTVESFEKTEVFLAEKVARRSPKLRGA